MNILVTTVPYVASLECNIIDGLLWLGHTVCNSTGKINYAQEYDANLDYKLWLMMDTDNDQARFAGASNRDGRAIPKIILHLHDRWTDYQNISRSPIKPIPYDGYYSMMFVRDLPKDFSKQVLKSVYPLDYSIERRYLEATDDYRDQERLPSLVFYGTLSTAGRRNTLQTANYAGIPVIYGEYKFNTADTKWSQWIHGRYTHDPAYYQELCKHMFAFVPWGAGPSTMRLGEVYAAGCIPVIQRYPSDIIPFHDFKDGQNCILWDTEDELINKLRYYREHIDEAETLRNKCFNWGQAELLTKHIAQWILDMVSQKHNLVG